MAPSSPEGAAQRLSRPFRDWDVFFGIDPRALPWAGISRPFGAERAISTLQVIEERIQLAKELDAATKHGEEMGLTDDEKAFYDALAANDSAKTAMGDDKLKLIAAELTRKSHTPDA